MRLEIAFTCGSLSLYGDGFGGDQAVETRWEVGFFFSFLSLSGGSEALTSRCGMSRSEKKKSLCVCNREIMERLVGSLGARWSDDGTTIKSAPTIAGKAGAVGGRSSSAF